MVSFLKMTVPAFTVSYLIFYFLYKKVGVEKLIDRKINRIVSSFLIGLLLYIVGLSIIDSFNTTKEYHSLFTGLFLGPTVGLVPFVTPVSNIKNK